MKCPYCGTENAPENKECIACQASLVVPENPSLVEEGIATVAVGNAQAQMQEEPKAAPLPVLEKEEKPKNLTEELIAQKERERANRPKKTVQEQRPLPTFDSKRLYGVLCYVTLLGTMIAYLATRENRDSYMKTHLNQGLIIGVAGLLSGFPLIGNILYIASGIATLFGIYYAVTGQDKKIPIIGEFEILK